MKTTLRSIIVLPFKAWYPLKSHTYLKKPEAEILFVWPSSVHQVLKG